MPAKAPPRLWIFDLDNTLHDASHRIFPHINQAMTDYIVRHLGVDAAAAGQIRQAYWRRYGATLQGLVRHHGVDPHHFLAETHRFDDLAAFLRWERGLRAALRRIPGRKVVFSNGPLRYARAVLAATGLRHAFDAVYAIESVRLLPKPARQAFLRVLHAERCPPRRAIMVEDSLENLRVAKALGMHTVWIHPGHRRPACVDVLTRSVRRLPRLAIRSLP